MADELNLLFVTMDKFPPFRPAAKAIFAGELTRRGCRIDWLLQAESEDVTSGAVGFGNGTAYVAPTDDGDSRLARVRKYWLDLRNDLRVFSLVRSGQYDLIQVKDRYLSALFALLASKLYRCPMYYWLAYPHGEASIYAARHDVARFPWVYLIRGTLQKWLLYRIIMPGARHVFVQSEQMKDDIAAEGVARDKMTAVPSSLDLAEVDGLEETPPAERPPDERWVVYLGTLIRERRLDFLVRVIARVLQQAPEVRLVLVGRGEHTEDEQLIMDEARRLGVEDKVRITGWLPMPEAWSYVRAADVCLSPYYPTPVLNSTSPTKLIEYMALRKAVVANDHPEQSLVVGESGCGLCCPWDEAEFASAVLELLLDSQRCRRMGDAGRRYVERHRTHAMLADVVAGGYQETLAKADA